MGRGRLLAAAAVVLLIGSASGVSWGVAAHPTSDHNPEIPAAVTRTFTGPPNEGPGDPDGDQGPLPFTLDKAVLQNICAGPGVAGLPGEDVACVHSGGGLWHACDGGGHELSGGDPAYDVPCSVPDSPSGGEIDGDLAYDRLTVDIRAAHPTTDEIPAMVAAESGDLGIVFGEGNCCDGSNDGNCEEWETEVGDVTLGTGLGCNDLGPGPKELHYGICTSAHELSRPSTDDLHGSGDGIAQQALSGETYRTHNLGPDKTVFDPPKDKPIGHHDLDESLVKLTREDHPHDVELRHPGVVMVGVYLRGPVHGPNYCGDYQRLGNVVRGEIRLQLS